MRSKYFIVDSGGRVVEWFWAKDGEEALVRFNSKKYSNTYELAVEVTKDTGGVDEDIPEDCVRM